MKNDYIIKKDCLEIFIKRKNGNLHSFLVDLSDFGKVVENYPNSWTLAERRNNFYVVGRLKGEQFYLHRMLTEAPKGMLVDHKNHNTLDNRIENLRVVTVTDNNRNLNGSTHRSETGVRGVYKWRDTGRYTASVGHLRKKIHLGYFDKLEDAQKAVEKARIEYGYLQNN